MTTTDYAARDTAIGPAQKIARLYGVVFLLVGILGFVPGITTHYSDMSFAGHASGAMLLGIFQVSVLHNIVHLLYGLAGLAMARAERTAETYLIVGGIIYAVLWIYGLIVGRDSSANFVPLNTGDNLVALRPGCHDDRRRSLRAPSGNGSTRPHLTGSASTHRTGAVRQAPVRWHGPCQPPTITRG